MNLAGRRVGVGEQRLGGAGGRGASHRGGGRDVQRHTGADGLPPAVFLQVRVCDGHRERETALGKPA